VRDVQPDLTLPGGPSITFESVDVLHADVIVGADGVKSTLQKVVMGLNDAPMPGDAAHRAVICTDSVLLDPELRPFVETPEMAAWMAPVRHLMAYNIVSGISLVPSIAWHVAFRV
jgi:salicylate hydroxylase